MSPPLRPAVVFVVTGLLLATGAPSLLANEQASSRAELAERIDEKVGQLHQVRAERRGVEADAGRSRERVEQQIDRLRDDQRELENERASLQNSIASLEDDLEQVRAQRDELGDALAMAVAPAQASLDRMREQLVTGIPHERERLLDRLERIEADLAADDADTRYEAVRALLALNSERLREAGVVALGNEPVTLPDGRETHAYHLRFGLVNQAFVSEADRLVGIAGPDADTQWAMDLSDDERRQLRHALDIVREQAAPELALVPFVLPGRNE